MGSRPLRRAQQSPAAAHAAIGEGEQRAREVESSLARVRSTARDMLDTFADWPAGGAPWPAGGVVAHVDTAAWDRWSAQLDAAEQHLTEHAGAQQ